MKIKEISIYQKNKIKEKIEKAKTKKIPVMLSINKDILTRIRVFCKKEKMSLSALSEMYYKLTLNEGEEKS